jgi:hypothetical protein
MLHRIIIFPRYIRPFLNRERRRVEGVILDSNGILARGASNGASNRTGARI